MLIEHYAGAFPLWLAPVQAVVIPVAERHHEYAQPGGGRRCAPRASASTWTIAARSWATRSAKPRSRRSPTCWWWATRKWRRGSVSVRHRHAGDLGRARTSTRSATKIARLAGGASARPRNSRPSPEVSHRPEDGPHQRPHPRQGSPRHRRRRRPARHHAAGAGADDRRGEGPRPRGDRGHRHAAGLPDHELRASSSTSRPSASREARKHQRHIQVKEVKFRPKIDEHDFQFKKRNVERFLLDGNKVKSTVIFRGREMVHNEIGRRILKRLAAELTEVALDRGAPASGRHDDGADPRRPRRKPAAKPARSAQGEGREPRRRRKAQGRRSRRPQRRRRHERARRMRKPKKGKLKLKSKRAAR